MWLNNFIILLVVCLENTLEIRMTKPLIGITTYNTKNPFERDIASNLRIVGHAPDGVIEAVEISDHPYALGVQWHPEWMTDQPTMQKLFKSFVDASK